MEKHTSSEYPYGYFPTKFTKLGQERYFNELKNTEQKVNITSAPEKPVNEQSNTSNTSFDIAKLLPILKIMGDKKSMSTTDMLQVFLPLLGGNNMSGIGEIMSLLNNKPSNDDIEEDIEPPNTIRIDEYKRVE